MFKGKVFTMKWTRMAILPALLALVQLATAVTFVEQGNSIMTHNALGLLIPLGIENFVAPVEAIMYYNYIGIGLIMLVASFAGQTNESRFLVFVPIFAALMVFIGWLQAPDPVTYWGMIIACILLGGFMYINDMNREKYGSGGPGSKVLTLAMMIIVFEASVVVMSTPTFSPFPEVVNPGQSQQSLTCGGYGYTCDSAGNIDLQASVTSVNNSGGTGLDLISMGTWVLSLAVAMIRFIILVLGAILLFSVVLVATYPVLAASPQALLILGVMQIVIWAIYMVAFFNWGFKPSYESARV